jgi:hypothetical protein
MYLWFRCSCKRPAGHFTKNRPQPHFTVCSEVLHRSLSWKIRAAGTYCALRFWTFLCHFTYSWTFLCHFACLMFWEFGLKRLTRFLCAFLKLQCVNILVKVSTSVLVK